MAAQGADPVSAIAGAVGDLANLVGSFVNKAAQKYGLQKGSEVEGISIERRKSLAAYEGMAANQQSAMLLILGVTAMIVILIFINKNK